LQAVVVEVHGVRRVWGAMRRARRPEPAATAEPRF
jgi:hypothetical protein